MAALVDAALLERFRFSILGFLLLVACGGASERSDEDGGRNGGTGGLGGTAARGGGSATGGTGATAGALEGDYWLVAELSNTFYVTVTEPTTAVIGRPFEGGYEYDIVHTPGAPLGPATGYMLPDVEVTGEYVLRRRDRDPNAFVFAFESSADSIQARAAFRSWPCHGQQSTMVYAGTATRDQDPPEARVTPEWGLAPPWRDLFVTTKRPVLAPISPGFLLTVDGAPIATTWADVTTWFGINTATKLDDWASFVGRSLELTGSLHGTNGTHGTFRTTVDVPDFGRHEGPVTFASVTPPDVALWGGATHYPAGAQGCPDGCVALPSEANVGMRFIRPGASLRVVAYGAISIDLLAPDGSGTTAGTSGATINDLTTTDVAIPFQTEDLFAVFRGPSSSYVGNCPGSSGGGAYLVSVEPAGTP